MTRDYDYYCPVPGCDAPLCYVQSGGVYILRCYSCSHVEPLPSAPPMSTGDAVKALQDAARTIQERLEARR